MVDFKNWKTYGFVALVALVPTIVLYNLGLANPDSQLMMYGAFGMLIMFVALLVMFPMYFWQKKEVRETAGSKYEPLAIAALILAIFGLFQVFSGVLALLLGIVSLIKMRKNPKLKGKPIAIAAVVLAVVALFLGVYALTSFIGNLQS